MKLVNNKSRLRIKTILFAGLILTLGSCSDSSSDKKAAEVSITGVDSNGKCTEPVRLANNTISDNIKLYNSSKNRDYLKPILEACKEIQSLLGIKTCLANVENSLEVKRFSYETDYKKSCEEAEKL